MASYLAPPDIYIEVPVEVLRDVAVAGPVVGLQVTVVQCHSPLNGAWLQDVGAVSHAGGLGHKIVVPANRIADDVDVLGQGEIGKAQALSPIRGALSLGVFVVVEVALTHVPAVADGYLPDVLVPLQWACVVGFIGEEGPVEIGQGKHQAGCFPLGVCIGQAAVNTRRIQGDLALAVIVLVPSVIVWGGGCLDGAVVAIVLIAVSAASGIVGVRILVVPDAIAVRVRFFPSVQVISGLVGVQGSAARVEGLASLSSGILTINEAVAVIVFRVGALVGFCALVRNFRGGRGAGKKQQQGESGHLYTQVASTGDAASFL